MVRGDQKTVQISVEGVVLIYNVGGRGGGGGAAELDLYGPLNSLDPLILF